MEVLFHFVFIIFKIAILSIVYASIIFALLILINNILTINWLKLIISNQRKLMLKLVLMISILLFIWLFTYWGDHGLGDSFRIPIGNDYAITAINTTESAFIDNLRTTCNNRVEMTKFAQIQNKVIGNLNSSFSEFKNSFFVLDISKKEVIEFQNAIELNNYSIKNDLPKSHELRDFEKNYNEYWSGWRLFLLP